MGQEMLTRGGMHDPISYIDPRTNAFSSINVPVPIPLLMPQMPQPPPASFFNPNSFGASGANSIMNNTAMMSANNALSNPSNQNAHQNRGGGGGGRKPAPAAGNKRGTGPRAGAPRQQFGGNQQQQQKPSPLSQNNSSQQSSNFYKGATQNSQVYSLFISSFCVLYCESINRFRFRIQHKDSRRICSLKLALVKDFCLSLVCR